MLEPLIKAGASTEHRDYSGKSLLLQTTAKALDQREFFDSAKKVFEKLCELGADVNAKDLDGNTALHYVVSNHSLILMDKLHKYGPKLYKNKHGKTPLDVAQEKKYSAMVNRLNHYETVEGMM